MPSDPTEAGADLPASGAGHSHALQLVPGGAAIAAPAHQTLLASALAAGVELDSACRNGTCRVCMRRLASGRVRYRIEWPGLSAEEKAEGYILPCVALPECDVVLAAPT